MSTNAKRLAKAVLARRTELDLSQLDVWQAGGPSNTTLTEIENGRTENLTRTTARRLDVGLRWEVGSAKRVWEGRGAPTPVVLSGKDEAWLREQIGDAEISPATRDRLLRALEDDERGSA